MDKPVLGRLEQVDLRGAWNNESTDFTPWLAEQENLELLGKAIGLELELEARERPLLKVSSERRSIGQRIQAKS